MGFMRIWLVLALLLVARVAAAETFHAPVGGRGFALGENRVACASPPGWTVEAQGRVLRPPTTKDAIGQVRELTVAASASECTTAPAKIRVVATGKIPAIDRNSVTRLVDEGRLEADGNLLDKSVVSWPTPTGLEADTCTVSPPRAPDGRAVPARTPPREHCIWSIPKTLPVDPTASQLRIWPAGSHVSADAEIFDEDGRRLAPSSQAITPTSVQVTNLLPPDASMDVSRGVGRLPLLHPGAVEGVQCANAVCRLEQGELRVQAPPENVSQIEARFTIAPGVSTPKHGPVVVKVDILRCPMEPVSGPVFRGLQSARVIVKLGAACARDVDALHFLADARPIEVAQRVVAGDATYVVLSVGLVNSPALALKAVRSGVDGVIAAARVETRAAPTPRTVLEIRGFPGVDFLPWNRDAIVRFPKIEGGELVLLPVDGVYSVARRGGVTYARGDREAAGLVTFQFAFRATSLEKPLSEIDLVTFLDPLQRTVKEANEPAPFDVTATTDRPLAELLCNDDAGNPERVKPGVQARFKYALRNGCRIVIHRERLESEYGAQKLHIEIEVHQVDGSLRAGASINERVVLRRGDLPKEFWVKGVSAPYDSVIVRITHEGDETHYLGGESLLKNAPAVQWSLVFGTGRVRIYATSAIPTGLYRFGGHAGSGTLALNFGIISRLTWVNSDGKEGLLGAEAGVMAFGLTSDASTSGATLTQVGGVAGLGLAIPIANASQTTQASINLHGWFEQRLTGGSSNGSSQAFIFGPSISIGNIGGTF